MKIFLVFLIFTLFGFVAMEETEVFCPKGCLCDFQHWSDMSVHQYLRQDYSKDDKSYIYTNDAHYYNVLMEDNPLVKIIICVLQPNVSLGDFFQNLPIDTEALTIIQGSGDAETTIYSHYLTRFEDLKLLEIKGTETFHNKLNFAIDEPLKFVTHMNLANIHVEKSQIQRKNFFEPIEKLQANQLNGKLLIPFIQELNETNDILAYDEYVKQKHRNQLPVFKGCDNLVMLRISGCNLSEIIWEMFEGLNKLKYLYLEDNLLKFIPKFAFFGTPKLEILSLAKNSLLDITIADLSGLLNLEYLDLSYNNFSQLSELTFPPFPNLKVADFRNNPITIIYPNTFEVMNTTKSIILGNIETPVSITPNAFVGLIQLETLKINNFQIGALKRELFAGMKSLTELELNGNIKSIEYDTFLDMNILEVLILSHSQIESVSIDAFFGLERVEILDLSWNNLETLSPGLFDPLIRIKEIYLNNNQFSKLPKGIFYHSPAKLIRLNGNPWDCNCDLMFWNPTIVNKIKRNRPKMCRLDYDKGIDCELENDAQYIYDRRVAPICATPLEFKKLGVFQVTTKKLRCLKSYKKSPKYTKKVKEYLMSNEKASNLNSTPIPVTTGQTTVDQKSFNSTSEPTLVTEATTAQVFRKPIYKKYRKSKKVNKIVDFRFSNNLDNNEMNNLI